MNKKKRYSHFTIVIDGSPAVFESTQNGPKNYGTIFVNGEEADSRKILYFYEIKNSLADVDCLMDSLGPCRAGERIVCSYCGKLPCVCNQKGYVSVPQGCKCAVSDWVTTVIPGVCDNFQKPDDDHDCCNICNHERKCHKKKV